MIGRNYVVAWTTQLEYSDRCKYVDTYETFENRQEAERKLARLEKRRATRQTLREARRMKDEVAQQIAQIDDDRMHSLRPTHQIPPNWRCVHIGKKRDFYKVVACTDNSFVSVYDGKTEYVLGREMTTVVGRNVHSVE